MKRIFLFIFVPLMFLSSCTNNSSVSKAVIPQRWDSRACFEWKSEQYEADMKYENGKCTFRIVLPEKIKNTVFEYNFDGCRVSKDSVILNYGDSTFNEFFPLKRLYRLLSRARTEKCKIHDEKSGTIYNFDGFKIEENKDGQIIKIEDNGCRFNFEY